ncbi:MAG: hypothetical protein ACI8UZ_000424 [Akkermansiaceae bacterium]|jgi:hypothetical protein
MDEKEPPLPPRQMEEPILPYTYHRPTALNGRAPSWAHIATISSQVIPSLPKQARRSSQPTMT